MSLKVAIQSDPFSNFNIDADSTFSLALEAQNRGYSLYYYSPKNLSLLNGQVQARLFPLKVQRVKGQHFTLGSEETVPLREMDIVLMRQDPPFDMGYFSSTHLLEHIHPLTYVFNDPISVRNSPEKLLATHFPDLMPPTLVTQDWTLIHRFRQDYKDIVLKPLFGNGGAGVVHIKPDDGNLNAILEMYASLYPEPIMAQAYVPAIRQGDKRVILIDGEASGALLRIPLAGEARSNLHVGGTAQKTELTRRDYEICEAIGPELRRRGLVFVGIDVIGDFLTEINVTSPTGIQEIGRFNSVSLEAKLWDAFERRFYESRS